ncbi:hypothetical protein DD237_006752 [Peronospora effusa]|uniref:Uncharacterized protein n=1 Tax=Peronospora effusa TaxID=542832 RepID=A0A425BW81_9STRA|nr:hypothetical protein DD237_006752 [Peronospora effusa]
MTEISACSQHSSKFQRPAAETNLRPHPEQASGRKPTARKEESDGHELFIVAESIKQHLYLFTSVTDGHE